MTQWLEQKFTLSQLFETFSTLDFLFHIHLKMFKGNMHLKTVAFWVTNPCRITRK